MKKYIHASTKITNEYLNELFKKIDWDDVDYADRLINRVLKKELGVDNPFDQAEYINKLNAKAKKDLMDLLENPEAIHAQRMKNKKSAKKPASSKNTELFVEYEDYPDGRVHKTTVKGSDRLDALKKLVDKLLLYIDVDEIESDGLSAEDVIHELESSNGDGCDYIIQLIDKSTGETLMEYNYEYPEDI